MGKKRKAERESDRRLFCFCQQSNMKGRWYFVVTSVRNGSMQNAVKLMRMKQKTWPGDTV